MDADALFPVVGIGASAGGLQAIKQFFEHMPADSGMAFVIVTHLPMGRESELPEIVGRYTKIPTGTAGADQAIELNHVYVSPPDHILTTDQGRLRLKAREDTIQRRPIDVFLSSLANDRGESAVGILLSGSGSDGALGMKAIKERGGLTLAQGADGVGPQHSEMPGAAIASGVVDLVLPAEQMADRLLEFARTFEPADDEQAVSAAESRAFEEQQRAICQILLKQVGHDFSGYKQKTFQRRVRRRMQVVQIDELGRYVQRLQEDPEEVTNLFRDLLIGVTNFFRDPEAFEALERLVIPQLFEGKGANDNVRVWVPGCATGEEVYSIAILLRERLETMTASPKVQLFATDIDEAALTVARVGRYPAPLMTNVSEARLKRHFTSDDVTYSVNKDIREMCVFSPHSVLRDPPFSRIDLISCRNLLIYLGTEFQAQVIPVFHFALKPRGYLFLGTSENVGQHADLFTAVDKKQRLFQRRDQILTPLQIPAFAPHGVRGPAALAGHRRESLGGALNLRRAVETTVMERFAPAHVVVNRDGDIVHYSPRTGKYLEPAAGLPDRQLIAMARRGLRLDLRAALREAVETHRPAQREHVTVDLDDRKQLVDLLVEPFSDGGAESLYIVLFKDVGPPFAPSASEALQRGDAGDERTDRLEQELRDTRERLQATVEEYETAVEELKSSNEELQSVNEELQSTNEELETSKEELQSLNEELHTVNAELNSKVEEVDRANADLRNVFESTQIATIFLDKDMIIRSFTPAVTSIYNLISGDRGRPLTDIASNLGTDDFKRDIQTVLERGDDSERAVSTADGQRHYLMRIHPYRAHNQRVQGAVITFVDVTRLAEAEARQRTLVEELNHRVRNMLTVVNAIANQTLHSSESPQEFAAAFTGRIRAMGSSFSLVSRENWKEVPFEEILSTQLAPFKIDGSGRLQLNGPRIMFQPTAALSLGMVVHELATNAVKHGALSKADGQLAVRWRIENTAAPSRLLVEWKEANGPPAKKKSRAKGFGLELIERELHSTLGATTKFDYGADGLVATFAIPMDPKVVSSPLEG